jgi:predicted DNA-binding antitoxin AbrB/MazE fold protein
MENSFSAIYKDGVLEPLSKIDLKEQQQVKLKVLSQKSIVQATKGMIKANAEYLQQVAESEELLEWNL